jgi:hypothetical protein
MKKRTINRKLMKSWLESNEDAKAVIIKKTRGSVLTLGKIFSGNYNNGGAPGPLVRDVFCQVSGLSEDELFPVIGE